MPQAHARHESSGPRILCAQDYIRKANAAFLRNDLKLSRECLRAALAFQPEDGELLLALGHVEFGLGHYPTALERYSVVVEMDPYCVEALSSRALTLQLLQRTREARAAAEATLAMEPGDLVALKVMARISLDTGGHDRAREYCRRILNVSPGDREALQFLDQCRFDVEAFLAEDPVPASRPRNLGNESKQQVAPEAAWAALNPPLPPAADSVLIKFPG